jgi:hypothetical protein
MGDEEIKGVVQVARPKFGFITKIIYESLCFTTERLIVAQSESLESDGVLGTTLGYWWASKKQKELAEAASKLSPEDILKAHKENYDIPYSNITKVELIKGFRYSVKVFEGTKKHQWYIDKDKKTQFENSINLVQSMLPGKLSIP